uniref:Uncharacterized protein n=1 Tax=Arundo donax TaxID=35708 RepID=A0A0A9F3V0_ARUDO
MTEDIINLPKIFFMKTFQVI